ncbi:hypothetical protein AS889_04650 [Pseudomonas putida]|uniref:Lar family restriction alleviation protein n=1 Tax=Pseudomonas putida TaxID=303 RepID=UPI0007716B50|nr:Lar family restriction alleviation protein [Pseudomonas putida]KWW18821.1 hypothetical protein AS889_04650 [Pseudomonas putida]
MTIEQEKLKPCPFCGGPVQLEKVYLRSGTWHGVKCRNTGNHGYDCTMEQVPSMTPEAAVKRWNMRKPEDELLAEIERLTEEVALGDKIIAERNRLVDAIPQCAAHGQCIPYAIQWVKDAQTDLAVLREVGDNLKADNEALRKALGEISGQVDGNIRCAVRDVVNCRGDVQDIYGYCDNIDEIIEAAMAKEADQ